MLPTDEEINDVQEVKDKYTPPEANNMEIPNVVVITQHNREVKSQRHGLKPWMTTLLIAGELVGAGILTLPKAMDQAGVLGFFMLLVFGCAACYAGMRLATCWEILMERWPEEYAEPVRDPYPAIAYKSFGKVGKIVTRIAMNITLFGGSTVFILLGSKFSQSLSGDAMPYCYWVLVFGAILAPIMWLGTPKDFWPVGVVALFSTVLAVILALGSIAYTKATKYEHVKVEHSEITVGTFSLAFGTILFMFGGASTFPTIQNDMADKTKFKKVLLVGFIIIIGILLPTALISYLCLGSKIQSVLLASVQQAAIRKISESLIIVHLLLAFFVVINPFCQDFEEMLHVPHRFGIKRIILRVCVMLSILFVSESVPHFDYILSAVGGSTITLLTFICPSIFYLKLTHTSSKEHGTEWPKRDVPLYEKIILVIIIIVGLIGGVLATYHSIEKLVSPGSFVAPCYINLKAAENS